MRTVAEIFFHRVFRLCLLLLCHGNVFFLIIQNARRHIQNSEPRQQETYICICEQQRPISNKASLQSVKHLLSFATSIIDLNIVHPLALQTDLSPIF